MFTAALKIVGVVVSLTLVSGAQYGGDKRRSFQTNTAELITNYSCEYYNKACVDRAKEDPAVEIGQCYGQESCEIGLNQVHGCMVAWKIVNVTGELNETADQEHRHPSGHDVHLMGCLPRDKQDRQCPDEDTCA